MREAAARRPDRVASRSRTPAWLTLVGLLAVAVNLRPAIAGLSPVLPDVRADLGLSRGAAGLLTTLPVLCFALLSPLAVALGRRFGTEVALLAALLFVVAGSLLRTAPGVAAVVAGTLVIGAGMTVGNVLVPSAVKADFPQREGLVTGLYTAAMIAGAAVAAAFAAPLDHAGLGWRGSLLAWGGLAAIGAVVWLPQLHTRHRPETTAEQAGLRAVVARSPVTWALAAFLGMQALLYYSVLAWLPALLRERGVSPANAGAALAALNLLGIISALVVPGLATRSSRSRGSGDQRWLAWSTCALWAVGLLGLLVAPGPYFLWVVLTGLGQGGGFALGMVLLVLRAGSPTVSRELSGFGQSVGYLIGAAGPLTIGALRDASGSWTLPLLTLGVATAAMAVASWLAAGNYVIGGSQPRGK